MENFTTNKNTFFVSFGGLGDCLIGIASAQFFKCTLIHCGMKVFSNGAAAELVINAFSVPNIVLEIEDYQRDKIYKILSSHPGCLGTWNKEQTTEKIHDLYIPFKKILNFQPVIICPADSSYKSGLKSLSPPELMQLTNKYPNCFVAVSPEQQEFYGNFRGVNWITLETLTDIDGTLKSIVPREYFEIILSAKLVISVDTWLKTFSAYANIPTKVIKNRSNNRQIDDIFLNTDMWNISVVALEELYSPIKFI